MTKAIYQTKLTRLGNAPIIYPEMSAKLEANINGPSLIKVPDWVESPLGKYYLYFADHKGDHIKLAYADHVEGPWALYEAGSLHLSETQFAQETPALPEDFDANQYSKPRGPGVPSILDDMTIPHIASPDIFIDDAKEQIRMYYHGLNGFKQQPSRVALSHDGIHFESQAQIVGHPYMRAFFHDGFTYGLAMPGIFYRSKDGLNEFEAGPTLFNPNMRHCAVLKKENRLLVFWTQVGDMPERIYLSEIDISSDWHHWQESASQEVLRPEYEYEGAMEALKPSLRSATSFANQLRDPAIFKEKDKLYLLYAIGGETGIAIARLELVKV